MAESSVDTAPRFKRRTFIVGGFQVAFLLTLLVWVALWLTAFAVAVMGPAVWANLRLSEQPTDPAVGTALLVLHDRMWWPLAGFFAGLAVVVVRETHRVAGPLYRFRQVFRRVAEGDVAEGVKVRDRDYLVEEAAEFDRMIAGIRSRASTVQLALARAAAALDALDRGETSSSPHRETLRRTIEQAREAAAGFRTTPEPAPAATVKVDAAAGFSLIELLIAGALISTIVAIGTPAYTSALTRARVARAIGDVNAIGKDISMHRISAGCFPADLSVVGHGARLDPWKNPYVYAVPDFGRGGGGGGGGRGGRGGPPAGSCGQCGGGCVSIGAARKDHNLVPINFDFDLYSKGKDGKSASPLTAGPSQDDIIRGRSGGFIGLASDY
jgi:general secretion pathway protein G